ncbi:Glycine oxidase ThiO [Chromohalobacter israelensis DSM 3043]|uniref:Glycine oxidase ThiO n=1 Tax=Chromohalobacter israelensis (strain ATCC BAA-138 / DSM 3043 / CIP 106854 / NCIMB 13768 / 1H11) TaxID=290398 RepID=Q1R0A2_CHRI1|nr:Glycine oxidase ThiO [Chromohalobacter salexigens DSM 3043]
MIDCGFRQPRTSVPVSEFLIVGGGVIGMMTALQLADAGRRVTLLERGECGREASWAGGGIVSPLYPWRYSAPISTLSRYSEGAYPELSLRLLEETGIDPEYRQRGLLYLRVDDEERALDWARQEGKPLQRVGPETIYAKEPNAAPGVESALWMPTLGSIRNPRLCRALRARLQAMPNVALREHVDVEELVASAGRIQGVRTSAGHETAECVVVCGGAWASQLLASVDVALPVRPVRGQMILFKAPPGLVERVVLKDGRYVIPRGDGRVVAGSTLEEVGFDKRTTEAAKGSLYDSALSIVPGLADCPVEHHWAGLRPGSPDGVPRIGAVPGVEGLWVNAGHYRNGLVLAPASTRLLADQLLQRTPVVDPAPYRLDT